MHHAFSEYYRPTEDEFRLLWDTAEIAFDTNVLLDLYRFSIYFRTDMLEVLGQVSERIWLPHQVAFEYQERRLGVLDEERQAYSDVKKQLANSKASALKSFTQRPRNLMLDQEEAKSVVGKAYELILAYVEEQEKAHPDLNGDGAPGDHDEVRDALDRLFEGKVGQPFSRERRLEIETDGTDRYRNEIPPGFSDDTKKGSSKFGDLLIWNQLMDRSRSTGKPLLFITNDDKEDWWLQVNNKSVLPHPKLVQEFKRETNQSFYMYRAPVFLLRAKDHLAASISPESVLEIEAYERQRQTLPSENHDVLMNLRTRLTDTEQRISTARRRRRQVMETSSGLNSFISRDELKSLDSRRRSLTDKYINLQRRAHLAASQDEAEGLDHAAATIISELNEISLQSEDSARQRYVAEANDPELIELYNLLIALELEASSIRTTIGALGAVAVE